MTFFWALSSVKDHVAYLEDLYLVLHENHYGESGSCKPVVCFRNAPALRRVFFNNPNRMPVSLTDFLPWVQITEYKADCDTDSWDFLHLMPNLLDLQLEGQRFPFQRPKLELELKKLRRLEVFRSNDVIQCLTLPALQDVTICLENAELLAVTDLIK